MEPNFFTSVLLPTVLAIIMLGLGLSLSLADFKRVLVFPKAVILGLLCQMILLPLLCFGITILFQLSPELSVGMMLLAASPGGASANLFSHLAKGDVALNVTLTAINSVLTLVTLPIIVLLSMNYFMQSGEKIPVQFQKIVEVFSLVLVPVALGMVLKYKFPLLSEKAERPVKFMSAVFLVLVILGAFANERGNALGFILDCGIAVWTLNIVSLTVGYFTPRFFHIERKQAISISMEVGIHNGILAMYIASSILGYNNMAIPAAVYGIVALINAAILTRRLNRYSRKHSL